MLFRSAESLKKSFWFTYFVNGRPKEYRGKTQNELPCDLRVAFVDYVDRAHRNGLISDKVAESVTL